MVCYIIINDYLFVTLLLYIAGQFKVIHSDTDVLTVVPNGEVILTKRLDYENLDNKQLSLTVEAKTVDNRRSTAKITVQVENLNDNAPIFEKNVGTYSQ